MDALVSTQWLADHLDDPDLVILDATYHALEPRHDAAADFTAGHIPGARFLDLETLADRASPLPSTVPTPEQFAARIGSLGIGDGTRVILYDQAPHHTAARAWWLFRLFGVGPVAILDGGLARWRAEQRPLRTGSAATVPPREPTLRQNRRLFRSKAQLRANLATGAEQVVDARSPARFTGSEADPRPGVASGHVPGARNLHYARLIDRDGSWKRGAALEAEFAAAGVDLDRPLVTTCGSGITAAVLLFGAHLLGKQDVALYDGSWSEWGADPDTPKATGAA